MYDKREDPIASTPVDRRLSDLAVRLLTVLRAAGPGVSLAVRWAAVRLGECDENTKVAVDELSAHGLIEDRDSDIRLTVPLHTLSAYLRPRTR